MKVKLTTSRKRGAQRSTGADRVNPRAAQLVTDQMRRGVRRNTRTVRTEDTTENALADTESVRDALMRVARQQGGASRIARQLTIDTLPATLYGPNSLFTLCTDDALMALTLGGSNPLADWIGWTGTDVWRREVGLILYEAPEGTAAGSPTTAWVTNPCEDSEGVEWGSTDWSIEGFGHLRRHGPTREAGRIGLRLCERSPIYRLNGTRIENDLEYDMAVAARVLNQDFSRGLVEGNGANPGQFHGLEALVATGYTDSQGRRVPMMDSIVIDWNGNGLNGGAGVTWNGQAVASTWNLVDVVMGAVRAVRRRMSMSPAMGNSPVAFGDMAIVGPQPVLEGILNAYVCWSVCEGTQYNETFLSVDGARELRQDLLDEGGNDYYAVISIDGQRIPLVAHEWGMINGSGLYDFYILTRQVAGQRLMYGEFNDMERVAATLEGDYESTDGGRFLTWPERDMTCLIRYTEMRPRLVIPAPWAQVRFMDVAYDTVGPMFAYDPISPYFDNAGYLYVAGS